MVIFHIFPLLMEVRNPKLTTTWHGDESLKNYLIFTTSTGFTFPETNSLNVKTDGLEDGISFWEKAYFLGLLLLVSGSLTTMIWGEVSCNIKQLA